MFIWMTALLTIVFLPLFLPFVKIKGVVLAKSWLPSDLVKSFPLSARTPIFHAVPRAWLKKRLDKSGIRGFALLGIVALNDDQEEVRTHEAIHVLQQSCFSPLLIGLMYLQEVGVFIPFRKYWRPGYWKRVPVTEKIAYKIAEKIDV